MNWRVKFVDYPTQFRRMEADIMGTIRSVLAAGDLMLRQQLRDFEANFAAFVGTRFAVGTSNCTDALHMSLRLAGIGPGDEVITVSHTFVATVAAIHHTGATPVLIDIADDHNMNVELIEPAITPRTKAIMPVSLNGRCCDLPAIVEIARRHGLQVIEDSAQALGGSVADKKAGSWGLAGCFSFYPAKLLGAFGDGGAVTTDSEGVAVKLRQLRDHGRTPSGDIAGWSFNCRLDNLHAAVLNLKLKQLPEWIVRRREIARLYDDRLAGLGRVRVPPRPVDNAHRFDVFQNYEIEAEDRDRLCEQLKLSGIEIMRPWGGRGVHQFESLGLTHFRLPRTEQFFQKALLLPMHVDLADEQVVYVTDVIRQFYGTRT